LARFQGGEGYWQLLENLCFNKDLRQHFIDRPLKFCIINFVYDLLIHTESTTSLNDLPHMNFPKFDILPQIEISFNVRFFSFHYKGTNELRTISSQSLYWMYCTIFCSYVYLCTRDNDKFEIATFDILRISCILNLILLFYSSAIFKSYTLLFFPSFAIQHIKGNVVKDMVIFVQYNIVRDI